MAEILPPQFKAGLASVMPPRVADYGCAQLENSLALGVLTTGNQTIAGAKTFSTAPSAPGYNVTGGGGVNISTTGASLVNGLIVATGIADAVATSILEVTVPNSNVASAIRLKLLSSNGGTDAWESSRIAEGWIVIARTTGANAVAVAATLVLAQIATVAAGGTHTLAYAVSAISGAVGAVNTFTINITIDDSAATGANRLVVAYEIMDSGAAISVATP